MRFLIFILISILFTSNTNSQILTESQAKEEAEFVIKHIKEKHPDQYWYNSKEEWDNYENKLLSRKGNIPIWKQYFDLAYLFSLATDTHTQIYPGSETPGFKEVFELRFRSFSDGLYIIAAGKNYESLIGKKVISFGNKSSDDFMQLLSNYVSADHPIRKKTLAEFLLVMPETYKYFDVMNDDDTVDLRLQDIHNKTFKVKIKQTRKASFAKVFYDEPNSFGILTPDNFKTVNDIFNVSVPFSRSKLREKYWSKKLTRADNKKIVYIQINENKDHESGVSQFDFILNLFQEISDDRDNIDRIIIDLRYNLGGWIRNTAALSRLLYGSGFYKEGKTIVLIGRETVSAGSILAADIEMSNYAYFIGEPSGSKPNMFLYHKPVNLPYSKFYAESSTEKDITTTEKDNRMYISPDLVLQESFKDYISGKDLVLEKSLRLTNDEIKPFRKGLYLGELWRRSSQNQ